MLYIINGKTPLEMVGRNMRIKPENTKKTIQEIIVFKNEAAVTNRIRKHSCYLFGKHIQRTDSL